MSMSGDVGVERLVSPVETESSPPNLLQEMGQQEMTVFGITGTLDDLAKMCPVDLSDPSVSIEATNDFVVKAINQAEGEVPEEFETVFKETSERLSLEPKYTIAQISSTNVNLEPGTQSEESDSVKIVDSSKSEYAEKARFAENHAQEEPDNDQLAVVGQPSGEEHHFKAEIVKAQEAVKEAQIVEVISKKELQSAEGDTETPIQASEPRVDIEIPASSPDRQEVHEAASVDEAENIIRSIEPFESAISNDSTLIVDEVLITETVINIPEDVIEDDSYSFTLGAAEAIANGVEEWSVPENPLSFSEDGFTFDKDRFDQFMTSTLDIFEEIDKEIPISSEPEIQIGTHKTATESVEVEDFINSLYEVALSEENQAVELTGIELLDVDFETTESKNKPSLLIELGDSLVLLDAEEKVYAQIIITEIVETVSVLSEDSELLIDAGEIKEVQNRLEKLCEQLFEITGVELNEKNIEIFIATLQDDKFLKYYHSKKPEPLFTKEQIALGRGSSTQTVCLMSQFSKLGKLALSS